MRRVVPLAGVEDDVAIVPSILTAADVAERIYKLIRKIQEDRVQSRNRDILLLQDDVDHLREAVELQTRLLQAQETDLADLRATLAELRQPKRRWFARL
jgi:hypothetical protein